MSIFHTNKIRTRAGIYTISEEEGVTPYDDDGVEVPPCRLNLSEYPLKELKEKDTTNLSHSSLTNVHSSRYLLSEFC